MRAATLLIVLAGGACGRPGASAGADAARPDSARALAVAPRPIRDCPMPVTLAETSGALPGDRVGATPRPPLVRGGAPPAMMPVAPSECANSLAP